MRSCLAVVSSVLLLLVSSAASSLAQQPSALGEDFSSETVGGAPTSFRPQAGFWSIATEDGRPVLVEDGSQWQGSGLANSLADQARAIYGDRWSEFIDDLAETAYFPVALFGRIENFSNGTLSMRFKVLGGNLDQDAGLAFNIQPNGDFMALRSDTQENNLLLYQWVQGQAMPLKRVELVPTTLGEWHEQTLVVSGTHLTGLLDGKVYLDATLDAPVSGQVGLWSKTDTVVLFDRFSVSATSAPAVAAPAPSAAGVTIRTTNLDEAVEWARQGDLTRLHGELQEFIADWRSIAPQVRQRSPDGADAVETALADVQAVLLDPAAPRPDQSLYLPLLVRLQQVVREQQQRLPTH